MIRLQTPKSVTSEMHSLAAECGADTGPLFIQITPDPDAQVDECHWNTKRRIEREGGEAVYGWVIWLAPSMYLEAMFHCVWQDQNGVLHDLTPDGDGEAQRLFFRSTSQTYDGRTLPSRWLPLSNSELVLDACAMFKEASDLHCSYSHGQQFPESVYAEIQSLQSEGNENIQREVRRTTAEHQALQRLRNRENTRREKQSLRRKKKAERKRKEHRK